MYLSLSRPARRQREGLSSHIRSALLCALLAGLLCAPPVAADKDYRIAGVEITAQLHEDGAMSVTESRSYDFDGSFRHAYRAIPLTGGVRYTDIRVSEGNTRFHQAESEEPGTYRVTRKSDELEVRWFFRARNELRKFDLHYRAENLVECYDDAALLYYQFIGDDWSESSHNVTLAVTPPGPLGREAVRGWLHGPLWAQLAISDEGVLRAWCERLPRRTLLEIRALYPPAAFPRAATREGYIRPTVMEEEARWAEEANQQRIAERERRERDQEREAFGQKLLPVLAVLGLFGCVFLLRRYGRRPELPGPIGMTGAPPSDTSPALVGYLLHSREVGPRDLVATLLDLARRGLLVLREETRQKGTLFGGTKQKTAYIWQLKREQYRQERAALLAYEEQLIAFLFDELAGGADEIDMATIKKKSRQVRGFFRQWRSAVKQEGKRRGYYDEDSLRGMAYGIALGVVMMVLAIPGLIFFGVWSLVLMGAGLITLLLALLIAHRTREGELEARGWNGLKRYLKSADLGTAGHSIAHSNIGAFLIYGAVLGLSAAAYRRLADAIPSEQLALFVPWYVGAFGSGHGDVAAGLGAAFSSMVATATSTVSSASGTGGGASGGGGGGAGGGGGGAG